MEFRYYRHQKIYAFALLAFAFGGSASAEAVEYCWIDAATGAQVSTIAVPATTGIDDYRNYRDSTDKNHISSTERGRTFVRQPDGSWIDSGTGAQVPTISVPATTGIDDYRNYRDSTDKNHISSTERGRTFVRVPCPQSTPQTSWTGPYIGGELAKNWGWVRSTETFAATGVRTNEFNNTGDPLGFGVVAGYDFAPWGNAVRVGPFASFDVLRENVRQTFAGGTFLGTRTNWFATLGARVGYVATNNFELYALTGVTFVNHDLQVNFATAASSNATTPGFTFGAGLEYRPDFAIGGNPVSLFAQYQHTWYAGATFNTPASSPAFNYAFLRRDDMVKAGFKIWFAPPAATPVSAKY